MLDLISKNDSPVSRRSISLSFGSLINGKALFVFAVSNFCKPIIESAPETILIVSVKTLSEF